MFIVGLIIVYEEIKSDLRRQKMEIYEQKYSNQIDKTKSYLFNIGLISEDNQIIESFKKFTKSYNNLNLSFFDKEKEKKNNP